MNTSKQAIGYWLSVIGALGLMVVAGQAADETFEALLERVLPAMGAEEIPARSQPQQELQEAVWRLGVPGKETELREACRLMAAKLGPGTSKPARVWLMTQIMRDGAAECVDGLAASLKAPDAQIRECARRALMNNPAPEATTALLNALKGAKTSEDKEALCIALAYRADSASVTPLAGLLKGSSGPVTIAAARALGNIANGDAARPLADALPAASGESRRRIGDAYLAYADKLAEEGKIAEALAIYAKLNASTEPQPVRLAALQGQLETSGVGVIPLILQHLEGEDYFARNVAAGFIQDLPAGTNLGALMAKLPALPEVAQELVLHALSGRRDRAVTTALQTLAKFGPESVRKAAVRCLGSLGDAKAVPVLVDVLLAGDACSGEARRSLSLLHGQGVEEAVITRMKAADDAGHKSTLIAVLQDRGSPGAAATLLEILGGSEERLRGVTLRALGRVGLPEHVPAMLQAMLKTEGRERKDAEKAVIEACGRVAKGQDPVDPILKALGEASPADKAGILPLVGYVGGKNALQVVKGSLKSTDDGLRGAAVAAICNWPDDDSLPILEQLAGNAKDAGHRARAVQAYVRLAVERRRADKEKLTMLRKAMELCDQDKERKLVLKRAVQVRRVAALRFVVPYLDQPELAGEAGRVVVYFAGRHEIVRPHKDEVKAALDKTLATAKDKWVQGQAKRLREGL